MKQTQNAFTTKTNIKKNITEMVFAIKANGMDCNYCIHRSQTSIALERKWRSSNGEVLARCCVVIFVCVVLIVLVLSCVLCSCSILFFVRGRLFPHIMCCSISFLHLTFRVNSTNCNCLRVRCKAV